MMARHLRWIAVFLVVFTIIEADPLEDSSVSPEEEATDTQDFGKALEDTAYQEEIRGRKIHLIARFTYGVFGFTHVRSREVMFLI